MNITRENIDTLNAVVKVDISKDDYSDKVEKILFYFFYAYDIFYRSF